MWCGSDLLTDVDQSRTSRWMFTMSNNLQLWGHWPSQTFSLKPPLSTDHTDVLQSWYKFQQRQIWIDAHFHYENIRVYEEEQQIFICVHWNHWWWSLLSVSCTHLCFSSHCCTQMFLSKSSITSKSSCDQYYICLICFPLHISHQFFPLNWKLSLSVSMFHLIKVPFKFFTWELKTLIKSGWWRHSYCPVAEIQMTEGLNWLKKKYIYINLNNIHLLLCSH